MSIQLTKQKAIEEHRKMWNWIAEQYENGSTEEAYMLKEQYCRDHGYFIISNECFCCEYDNQVANNVCDGCKYCPLLWGTESKTSDFFCEYKDTGLWTRMWQLTRYGSTILEHIEAAKIARQIANLPERPDKQGDIL